MKRCSLEDGEGERGFLGRRIRIGFEKRRDIDKLIRVKFESYIEKYFQESFPASWE